jgi:hypothetical protein
MHELVKLGIDAYKGTTGQFSNAQASETMRKALMELNGGSDKIDYKAFRRNKVAIFEIIEETLAVIVAEGLSAQFDQFAEVRNLAWGDTNVFHIPNTDLFQVATIADGTSNLRRQRLDSNEVAVGVGTYGVKIYEELHRFLAGRIDWVGMVSRIAKSYNQKIANDVYSAIYNSYSALTAPYGVSAAYTQDALIDMAQHVEAAANGDSALIFGTKKALSKVAPSNLSDNMKDRMNSMGYYGEIAGYQMREIKQAHKAGTDTFAVNDDFLLIVPTSMDKFVKIVNEGTALIVDGSNDNSTADMSMEYTYVMKSGIAVLKTHKYGIYRLA